MNIRKLLITLLSVSALTLIMSSTALAVGITKDLQINVNTHVNNSTCSSLSVTEMDFGVYYPLDDTATTAQATISYTCSINMPVSIRAQQSEAVINFTTHRGLSFALCFVNKRSCFGTVEDLQSDQSINLEKDVVGGGLQNSPETLKIYGFIPGQQITNNDDYEGTYYIYMDW